MADGPGVTVDFVVVASGEGLVTEEVDRLVLDTGDVLLGLDMLQTIGFVPASGENVERDLTTDGVTRTMNPSDQSQETVRPRRQFITYVRP